MRTTFRNLLYELFTFSKTEFLVIILITLETALFYEYTRTTVFINVSADKVIGGYKADICALPHITH